VNKCAALSILSVFLSYSFKDAPGITTLLNRLSVMFILFLVAIHLYFSMIFPVVQIRRPLVTLCVICGPVLLLALPIIWTDLFVKTMVIQGMDHHLVMVRDVGIFYKGVYAPLVIGYILLTCAMFAWQYRMAPSGIAGKQVIYTAMAMAGGGVVITISCIVLPLVGITRYYQVGPLFMAPFYVTVMAINIISLRAMDVAQFMVRLFLWALSILVMGLLISFAVGEIWAHSHRYHLAGATLLLLACFMAGFIYMILIQPRISRWLQRKSHGHAKIVDKFHNKILQLKTVDHLAELICKTISTFLKPKHISIFLRRAGSPRFFLKQGHNYDGPGVIDVQRDQLQAIPQFDRVIEKEQVAQNKQYAVYRKTGMSYFAKFDCLLIIPIIYKEELIGVINVGPRFQGFYKRLEIIFLEKLMTGINVAFSNAMLLDRIETINTCLTRFVPLKGLQLMGHEQITDVKLGDSVQREMTIVFCDVKGFAALSEQMTPRENFQFLNGLLKGLSPVIRMHNGFIDKYMGDAIMALFPGSPRDGVNAAIGMLKVLNRYNQDSRINGRFPVQVGIGIHTGMLMLGTIGEQERMDSTVISDAVNLAQRIERMTRLFGVSLIISDAVAAFVGKDQTQDIRYLGHVKVKGKKNPVSLYERFDADPASIRRLKQETRPLFERGVGHYFHNERSLALGCFKSVLATGLDDPASLAYIKGHRRFCVEIKGG
jgi:class 3 adenylate cyclase